MEKITQLGALGSVFLAKYYSADQIKKNEMGGACGTYETVERHTGFWWGDLTERDHLQDV
jgi:hypothetical protein